MYVKQKGLKFGDTENAYKTIQCFLNQMFIISDLTRRNTAAFKVQGGRSRDARERSAEENRKTRSEDLFYKYAKEWDTVDTVYRSTVWRNLSSVCISYQFMSILQRC